MISVKVSLSQLTYGGPSTFVNRFSKYLKNKNISFNFYNSKEKASVILVISGTKKLGWLLYHKLIGTRIIQRLDGFEWKYNYESHSIGYSIKCKLINLNMNLIRKYLSDHIVYQSLYLEQEWNNKFGKSNKSFSVIHNSADDIFFNKQSKRIDRSSKDEKYKILCVEGTIQNDMVTQKMLKILESAVSNNEQLEKVELYGNNSLINKSLYDSEIMDFKGAIDRDRIHEIYDYTNLIFFILEINPPCPNALIEAISAGVPAIGFDTGSFKEIIKDAGIFLKYDKESKKLEVPNFDKVEVSIEEIIRNYSHYVEKAVKVSKDYRVSIMGDKYLRVLLP